MPQFVANLIRVVTAGAFIALLGVSHFVWISHNYEPGDSLCFAEKLTVYSGHAAMVAGGFVTGHPEVAQEAFYLHIDGPEKREWFSRFPAGSRRVQKAMKKTNAKLKGGAPHARATVAWPRYTYNNQRYGLALNSFDIVATLTDDGDVMYRGAVECSYPEDAPVTIGPGSFQFTLNEGVYHALQDAGWLHPYTAVWWWDGPLEVNVDSAARVAR